MHKSTTHFSRCILEYNDSTIHPQFNFEFGLHTIYWVRPPSWFQSGDELKRNYASVGSSLTVAYTNYPMSGQMINILRIFEAKAIKVRVSMRQIRSA